MAAAPTLGRSRAVEKDRGVAILDARGRDAKRAVVVGRRAANMLCGALKEAGRQIGDTLVPP